MSYDLGFLRRHSSVPVSAQDLVQYFGSRPHYTTQERQFLYENEDTGVYFSFELDSDDGDGVDPDEEPVEEIADGLERVGLSFNINYFRPHFFGLEAEAELAALIGRFSLMVDDPQNEGMGRGEYSREGFLRAWNAGNLFGYYSCVSRITEGEHSISNPHVDALPAAALEAMWSWNFRRALLQETLEEDAFVPSIRLVRYEGRPKTFVVWGDAIPEAIPDVDLLVLVRDILAPRRLLRRKKDICVVGAAELRPLLSMARRVEGEASYHLFCHDQLPRPLVDFFQSRKPLAAPLDGLAYDKVLTQEPLEMATASIKMRSGAP